MLVKWVRCRVVDPAAFSRGQRGWGALAEVPGFLGQCGGWSEPDVAHVFALWRTAEDHEAFLTGPHDRMAEAQRGSFDEIEVRFYADPALVADDLARLGAGVVELDLSWSVPPAV